MSKINLLPEELIGKIAAGEVVERPASIVKELVENSIDSGALEISVDITEGGKGSISVIDDGCGMGAEDMKRSVLRHATSKIISEGDLFNIKTMGFRGEALPSIASVSKFTIESKLKGEPVGHKMLAAGSKIVEFGESGCPDGTRVLADDIFFNTPARKKFLKSEKTEEGHVVDVMCRLAIANPEIRFKLKADGKDKLSCLSVNDPSARIMEVFGKKLSELTISFKEGADGLCIHGFLGLPESIGMVSQGVYLFINKRFVRDRVINHAVMNGYRSLAPSGSSPFAVIMLDIDPSKVDVNVHPTKQEVRFENSGAIHGFVEMAVRKNIQKKISNFRSQISDVGIQNTNSSAIGSDVGNLEFVIPAKAGIPLMQLDPRVRGDDMHKVNDTSFFSRLHLIGQLFDSFILCEDHSGGFIAIDQHAAHERIGFEKLKQQLSGKGIERQRLLIPERIELQPKDGAYISENLELLEGLGLEVEPFGGKTYIIKTVPAVLADIDARALILKIAADLMDLGKESSLETVREKMLMTMACHRQVRANHRLKPDEMASLLKQMDDWPNTKRCPHGRPTYKTFSRSEVSKWFERG